MKVFRRESISCSNKLYEGGDGAEENFVGNFEKCTKKRIMFADFLVICFSFWKKERGTKKCRKRSFWHWWSFWMVLDMGSTTNFWNGRSCWFSFRLFEVKRQQLIKIMVFRAWNHKKKHGHIDFMLINCLIIIYHWFFERKSFNLFCLRGKSHCLLLFF